MTEDNHPWWVLALADVHGHVDNPQPIAIFRTREAGYRWEQMQRSPTPYISEPGADFWGRVHTYNLVYHEDSPLHWFNPPDGEGLYPVYLPRGEEEAKCREMGVLYFNE